MTKITEQQIKDIEDLGFVIKIKHPEESFCRYIIVCMNGVEHNIFQMDIDEIFGITKNEYMKECNSFGINYNGNPIRIFLDGSISF